MHILVTGASGQVGSAIAERIRQSVTVTATDRSALDLSKLDLIEGVLDRTAPDLVINAAAYTAVDRAEQEPELAQRVNAEAPGVTAQWCAQHDVPLIHFSTDYVFDGSGTRPWSEDDPPNPLSVYGKSKSAGEEEIRAAGGSFLIIRTSWVYAARGANFLSKIAELAKTETELRVVSDQIGAPTPASFIAECLPAMLAGGIADFRDKARRSAGIVHLVASGETSWYEFAGAIVNGLQSRGVSLAIERIIPIKTEERREAARRPLNSRLELRRLRTVFGIDPPHWQQLLGPELDRLASTPAHRAGRQNGVAST